MTNDHLRSTRPSTRCCCQGRRRLVACAGPGRHRWRSATCNAAFAGGGRRLPACASSPRPLLAAARVQRTSARREPPRFGAAQMASRPAARRPTNSILDDAASVLARLSRVRSAGLQPPLTAACWRVGPLPRAYGPACNPVSCGASPARSSHSWHPSSDGCSRSSECRCRQPVRGPEGEPTEGAKRQFPDTSVKGIAVD